MFNHFLLQVLLVLIDLSPSGDEWFETEVAPVVIVNVEGNFNAVVSANQKCNRNSLECVGNNLEWNYNNK